MEYRSMSWDAAEAARKRGGIPEFRNEAFTDFTKEMNREAMKRALKAVDRQKGKDYPVIIGGAGYMTESKIASINPSKTDEIIGTVSGADLNLAEKAVQEAARVFAEWRCVSARQRAEHLFRAAESLRSRKLEFSAWLVEEAGKTWGEADGDTAEAIDFLEYYARQIIRLSEGIEVVTCKGEYNECNYIPLGVGVIISPWNFPLAILTGMTAAAVAAGNTVIVKPSSATPVIAAKLMEVWQDAGLPAGVVNFVPGSGGVLGDYLVSHPQVRFINFTGSKEVGIRINRLAAEIAPGQKWLKRVVAEMGGKDAIIVDCEADLDAAADAIAVSAFGFQGQKCSACSRAIIDARVYDIMLGKIVERAKAIKVDASRKPDTHMGPVIDEKAYRKILDYIEIGKSEGRLLVGGSACGRNGYFIEPTVIADVDPKARIAQEEIFGPVLAVIKAEDFDHALMIANDTEYGLTGAFFSKNRDKLDRAGREFHVGNLYLNRKCTGALVGVNPFGGFNMSGTDSKAGGPDYLTLFMQLKSVARKL